MYSGHPRPRVVFDIAVQLIGGTDADGTWTAVSMLALQ